MLRSSYLARSYYCAVCNGFLSSNSTYSIFVVDLLYSKLYNKSRDVVQQIESLQQVHNKSKVEFSTRLAVDLLYRSSQSRKRVYMTYDVYMT